MEGVLHGLLIGGLMGISIGPLAFACACLWRTSRCRTVAGIFGGSIGDTCVTALVLVLVGQFGVSVVDIKTIVQASAWYEAVPVAIVGLVLCVVASKAAHLIVRISCRWCFVVAFLVTAVRLDTIGLAAFYLWWFGAAQDDVGLFLPACLAGAAVTWTGTVIGFILAHASLLSLRRRAKAIVIAALPACIGLCALIAAVPAR